MYSCILALTILNFAGQKELDRPVWVDQILAARIYPGPALNSAKPQDASMEGWRVEQVSEDSRILIPPPDVLQVIELSNRVTLYVHRLLNEDRAKDAYHFCMEAPNIQPKLTRSGFGTELIDACLLLGKYEEAYELLYPIVENERLRMGSARIGEEYYLRLSLIASARGLAFAGQEEYCREYIAAAYMATTGSRQKEHLPPLPKSNPLNPKHVTLMSALALGTKQKPAFDEFVLRCDPTNTYAALRLIDYYKAKRVFSKAKRVASGLGARLSSGPERERLARIEAEMALRRDDPLDPPAIRPLLTLDPPANTR